MRWWKLAQREHKVQPWKQLTVPVSSNKDHGLPLDVIAAGDAPCLKRAEKWKKRSEVKGWGNISGRQQHPGVGVDWSHH
ncbi:hypothetical protein F2Q69_00053899 [Brassica cretica]|uniref:Uncharacterized protein n=1 Tax=Brassica cretica TaxID=69181 RepID=A0A8S9MTU6_BRACR|nr:hypothetical protein F2Q69_00053899 [Brassica cretica]